MAFLVFSGVGGICGGLVYLLLSREHAADFWGSGLLCNASLGIVGGAWAGFAIASERTPSRSGLGIVAAFVTGLLFAAVFWSGTIPQQRIRE